MKANEDMTAKELLEIMANTCTATIDCSECELYKEICDESPWHWKIHEILEKAKKLKAAKKQRRR